MDTFLLCHGYVVSYHCGPDGPKSGVGWIAKTSTVTLGTSQLVGSTHVSGTGPLQ